MADVNEIISKEALEGLRKANQYFIDIDGNIRKSIDELKAFNTGFRNVSATQENIIAGQKTLQNQSAKLTQIQKDEAKAIKATESAAAALNKQRQAALSQLAKQEAKERELAATLKMEVKTLQDAQRQNSALTQARKTLDLTTEKGRATLANYNASLDKNTKFIRENSDAAGKQRMNIGNYQSAVSGLTKVIAGIGAAWASLTFFKDAFREYEQQEQANRKLLFALKDNKVAFKELTSQANEFQSKTGIADDAIQGIQVLAAESGKSVKQIKDITEATITWSKITGQDLQSAYLQINGTLNGTAGRLTRVDAEFGKLTKTQLESGAAIDLINTKFKGFAENATTDTERLSANWNEFKELIGKSVSGVIVPALSTLNKALTVLNNESFSFSEKMAIMRTGNYNLALSVIERKKAEEASKKSTEQSAIANAASTKEIIKNAQAQGKAKAQTLDYSEAYKIAAENAKKFKTEIEEQPGAYQKLSQSISDTKEEINNLLAAGQRPSDTLMTQLQEQEKQLYEVGKAAEFAALRLIAVQQGTFEPTLTGKGISNISSTAKAGKSRLTARTTDVGGAPQGTELFAPGEATDFAIEQAQVVSDTTFQIMADSANAEFDLKMSLLEKEKDAKLDNAKLTEAQKKKIEDDYNKKAAKLKTDQFKKQKSADIIQAIINTALAVTKSLPNIPLSIASAVAGAAQIAIISAQKVPQFDSGSTSTPSQFIAGERRPEFMITPSGGVQLVTKPTLFKNMAGATVIGGEETAEIMRATNAGTKPESLAPYIREMKSDIVNAIKNKRELHISAKGDKIIEREGNWNKEYFNRKISWGVRKN